MDTHMKGQSMSKETGGPAIYETILSSMPDDYLRGLLAMLNRTRRRGIGFGLNGRNAMFPRRDVRAFVLQEIDRRQARFADAMLRAREG